MYRYSVSYRCSQGDSSIHQSGIIGWRSNNSFFNGSHHVLYWDNNDVQDIYLHGSITSGPSFPVSISNGSELGNDISTSPSISDDGGLLPFLPCDQPCSW